jgi:hypothetical protein
MAETRAQVPARLFVACAATSPAVTPSTVRISEPVIAVSVRVRVIFSSIRESSPERAFLRVPTARSDDVLQAVICSPSEAISRSPGPPAPAATVGS